MNLRPLQDQLSLGVEARRSGPPLLPDVRQGCRVVGKEAYCLALKSVGELKESLPDRSKLQ